MSQGEVGSESLVGSYSETKPEGPESGFGVHCPQCRENFHSTAQWRLEVGVRNRLVCVCAARACVSVCVCVGGVMNGESKRDTDECSESIATNGRLGR